ncbi:MAG: hypothetical protein P8Z71_07595 [Candidatus Sulfobium sp.]|jgi:hypothetical protein
MKKWICLTAVCLGFIMTGASSGGAQTRVAGGYTFVGGGTGPQVCLGRWIPSGDIAAPGTCEGQMVDVAQLTALSTGQSADSLSQILVSLTSIDEKLAVSNDRLERLVDATVNTQNSINEQARSLSGILHEIIIRRFDELPAEVMASKKFKEEIEKLKEEILGDVRKLYPARPSPPTK